LFKIYCCPVNFYSADVLELLCLQKQGKQLSLLDKREYPKGEGV
jgi:hypothetical protein